MDVILFIIAVGLIAILNVLAIAMLDSRMVTMARKLCAANRLLSEQVAAEHKKTRKETQEIKTRLSQVRKDLNAPERRKR